MQGIATICLDIAKPFQVHGVNAKGKVALQAQRAGILPEAAAMPSRYRRPM